MSLCPEGEKRAAMSDEDFFAYVLGGRRIVEFEEPEISLGYDISAPCPECGEAGCCAVDSLGRRMVHIIEKDREEDV